MLNGQELLQIFFFFFFFLENSIEAVIYTDALWIIKHIYQLYKNIFFNLSHTSHDSWYWVQPNWQLGLGQNYLDLNHVSNA